MSEKNILGGANPAGLYMPMSDLEAEACLKMASENMFDVRSRCLGGAGEILASGSRDYTVIVGDKRLTFQWDQTFDRGGELFVVDLELRDRRTNNILVKERQGAMMNNQSITVFEGRVTTLVWDIEVKSLPPEFVKSVLTTSGHGLTSKLQDRDTGEMTRYGNMSLSAQQRKAIDSLLHKENQFRQMDASKLRKTHASMGSSGRAVQAVESIEEVR